MSNKIMEQVTAAIRAGDNVLAHQLITDNNLLQNDVFVGNCVAVAMVHGQCVFARELLLQNPHALSAVRIDRRDPAMAGVPNALTLINDMARAQQCDRTYLIMRNASQSNVQTKKKYSCSVQ